MLLLLFEGCPLPKGVESAPTVDSGTPFPDDTASCDVPCHCDSVASLEDGRIFGSIQAALEEVADGGTVFVCAGEHLENLNMLEGRNPVWQGGSLSIVGEDADSTIIRGTGDGPVVSIDSATITISGVTITGGTGLRRYIDDGAQYWEAGGGIMDSFGNLELVEVVVSGNSASHGGAIYVGGWEDIKPVVTVRDSSIVSNLASDEGGSGATCGGAACLVYEYTLVSIDTDWGLGTGDNHPDDVGLANFTSYSFDGVTSFTCDSDTHSCVSL